MTAHQTAIRRAMAGVPRVFPGAAWNDPVIARAITGIRRGTGWSLTASTVLHALLFIWLIVLWRPEPEVPPITEITFLEPGDLAAPAPARSGSATTEAAAPGRLAASDQQVQFRRESQAAELQLDSQSPQAIEDRLTARLAVLQGSTGVGLSGAVVPTPTTQWGSTPATVSGAGTGGSAPVALKRGGTGTAPSLELTRGGADIAPALVATPAPAERAASQAPARGEATARRTLAGVTLMGPIADRAILAHTTPVYPEWAKREAVEGSVTLYFVVRADGTVKENILVQKTAGFEEFDENARAALAAWRFEPLRDGRTGEQWGNITFHFRLRGGS